MAGRARPAKADSTVPASASRWDAAEVQYLGDRRVRLSVIKDGVTRHAVVQLDPVDGHGEDIFKRAEMLQIVEVWAQRLNAGQTDLGPRVELQIEKNVYALPVRAFEEV